MRHKALLAATSTPQPPPARTGTNRDEGKARGRHSSQRMQGSQAQTTSVSSSSTQATEPTTPGYTHLHPPPPDGASKEGTTPMAPPPSNPKDFEHSPGTEVGVGGLGPRQRLQEGERRQRRRRRSGQRPRISSGPKAPHQLPHSINSGAKDAKRWDLRGGESQNQGN